MRHQMTLLRSVVGGLAVSGFLAGCGTEGVQSSPTEPAETNSGEAASAKSKLPKVRGPERQSQLRATAGSRENMPIDGVSLPAVLKREFRVRTSSESDPCVL